MKPSFKFDKHIFPPDSSPFRRGMAIGIAIGVATMVVLFVAMSGMGGMPAMIAFSVALVATEPWSRFLPGTFFNLFAGIFINGLILGVVLGVIFKMRQSRDA